MNTDYERLPQSLRQRAVLSGNEYAWHLCDIPEVIEAARQANLINIGGQLQFLLPNDGICECYWVEVDTYRSVSISLPWTERVEKTASTALADFLHLSSKFDFVAEGRKAFNEHFQKLELQGYNPAESMYFVWDVAADENV